MVSFELTIDRITSSLITSIMFTVTYGQKIDEMDHDYVVTAQVAMEGLTEATVLGRYWVEAFPFLRYIPSWVPWTSARRVAERYAPTVALAKDKPFQEVESLVACHLPFHRRCMLITVMYSSVKALRRLVWRAFSSKTSMQSMAERLKQYSTRP